MPRPAKPKALRTFTIRVYRVNGVLEIPGVMATTLAEARKKACAEAAAGLRQQPGGPTVYFGEDRAIHFIAVEAGHETRQPWPTR